MTKTKEDPHFALERKNGEEEKENTPKEKSSPSSSSSSKKTNNKAKKKTANTNPENQKKNQNKKYKLTREVISSDSDDSDENLSLDEYSEEETKFSPDSPTNNNSNSDDDEEPVTRKRKGRKNDDGPSSRKIKMKFKKEHQRNYIDDDDDDDDNALPEGWDARRDIATKNINFKKWQMSHSNRDVYFFGPDNYIYPNPSTMKKFIDAIQKKEIEEEMVSIMVKPMKKIVGVNPSMYIGITGLRYLSGGGTFNVTPQIYVAKQYQSEQNYSAAGFKMIKIHMPLHCLDNVKDAYHELSTFLEILGVKKGNKQ